MNGYDYGQHPSSISHHIKKGFVKKPAMDLEIKKPHILIWSAISNYCFARHTSRIAIIFLGMLI
jgi:hypothetical protein